jgi:hypothetical protein
MCDFHPVAFFQGGPGNGSQFEVHSVDSPARAMHCGLRDWPAPALLVRHGFPHLPEGAGVPGEHRQQVPCLEPGRGLLLLPSFSGRTRDVSEVVVRTACLPNRVRTGFRELMVVT